MARRIDFYDDDAAPAANSLVPSVNVVVTNAAGDVLLIRRSDNQNWAVPGGAIDLGESMVQAAVRETKEETGIDCEITGLVGIYTDPKHVILYTSNGEVRQSPPPRRGMLDGIKVLLIVTAVVALLLAVITVGRVVGCGRSARKRREEHLLTRARNCADPAVPGTQKI